MGGRLIVPMSVYTSKRMYLSCFIPEKAAEEFQVSEISIFPPSIWLSIFLALRSDLDLIDGNLFII
jgi:hypothetical protein